MTGMQKKMRVKALILLGTALLVVSLLFSACAHNLGGAGQSNAPTQQGSTSTTTSGTSDNSLQGINQDIQNSLQGIDGAQTDVANADATATNENGSDPQP